jgi:hypothetical protein
MIFSVDLDPDGRENVMREPMRILSKTRRERSI